MTSLNNTISSHGNVIARQLTSSRFLKLHHLRTLCQIILIVLLARQLAIITWQLLPDNTLEQSTVQSIRAQIPAARSTGNTNPLSSLESLQLFGKPPAPQQVQAPAPEDVPVSRLAVRITGLVASNNPDESLVIIRSGSSDATYRPGDTLKGTRATVDTIYADRVIIRNGERYESLLMYPDEANKRPVQRTTQKTTTIHPAKSNTVADIRRKLQDKPDSWAEIVTISPVRRDGELQGYRVNPAQYPDYFTQLGLKANDMAVAINGYDLTDTNEAMKVIGQLSSMNQISLTIERDGQRFEIDLSS
ncbi:type II secretion system protein GspC [Endozoicomonas atrinae]|uniref:type II secretion system protein GspC n=1 Tax=Endozoicomonas atrinae TaxID=1333660 RepID=UPI0008244AA2|nr:type II secretion system protein GspC [Endozoicomonas atrinae]